MKYNSIGGVMVSMLISSAVDHDNVKPNILKLVFVVFR